MSVTESSAVPTGLIDALRLNPAFKRRAIVAASLRDDVPADSVTDPVAVDVPITLSDGSAYTCVQVRDSNPLDPAAGDEFKYYAPGVGLVWEGPVDGSERIERVGME